MVRARAVRKACNLAIILAALRVAIFWFLFAQLKANSQSISLLPLIVTLYPEGLITDRNHQWTVGSGILFSGFLVVGTFFLVVAVAGLYLLLRKLRRVGAAV